MNKEWVDASHKSADYFRDGRKEHNEAMQLITVLDMMGLFETSWYVFKHSHNNRYNRFGYPK